MVEPVNFGLDKKEEQKPNRKQRRAYAAEQRKAQRKQLKRLEARAKVQFERMQAQAVSTSTPEEYELSQ